MRDRYFSQIMVSIIPMLVLLLSIPLTAVELVTVGRKTAEYFDGSTWTQLYEQKQHETNLLLGVWGAPGEGIFTVGENGTIACCYDGERWFDMYSGTTARLEGIWGLSGSDIFAVGAGGKILRFNGVTWSTMPPANENDLYAIHGTSSNDIYAVGDNVVIHYNGYIWSRVDTGFLEEFRAVWASPSGEVFISYFGHIIYFNGSSWRKLQKNPAVSTIRDIWGASADDVFFVCDSGMIIHYDGKDFTSVDVGSAHLYGISGHTRDDLWVTSNSGVAFHYDGIDWTASPINSNMIFYDIFMVSPDNIITVGKNYYTDYQAVIFQFDGVDWSYMMPDALPAFSHVWAESSDDVYATGMRAWEESAVFHYDGSEWNEKSPVPPPYIINDIWGASDDNVFMINRDDDIIFHFDGTNWSEMAYIGDRGLEDIWGNSNSDVYVLDYSGKIYHYDGSEWSQIAVAPYMGMSSIYGSINGEIFVVGEYMDWQDELCYGYISHYDGSSWTTWELYSSGCKMGPTTIWGFSPDDVYFTISTLAFHYDGVELSTIELPEEFGAAYGVWGDHGGNLYYANWTDEIQHFDGSNWSVIQSGYGEILVGIWGYDGSLTDSPEIPVPRFTLGQNYPNPFNPVTTIDYFLEMDGNVTLDIYSVSGQLVCTLLDEFQSGGKHSIRWEGLDNEGRSVASGIYFCRIRSSSGTQTKKMVLAR